MSVHRADATYDPAQLRTFLAVAQTLSFTQAARRLGIRQSTVSQHVRRLEEAAGRQLFARDTHRVDLTADGEAMLGFAGSILSAHERAAAFFAGTRLRGRLRFGASEDSRAHPAPRDPGVLPPRSSGGRAPAHRGAVRDAAPAARGGPAGSGAGQTADRGHPRRTDVAGRPDWIGAPQLRLDPERPVPLVVFPPPAITRARALEVLEEHGRAWRIACTSTSLSGLVAAARAGLGVMAHSRG